MPEQGGTEADFLLARPLRRAADYDACFKCIVGGAAARASHLRIVEGSHYAYAADDPARLAAPMEPCGLYLAHFYYRSAEQFRAKAVVAWMNIAAQYSRDALTGGGYRAFAARAAAGDAMADKDLTRGGELCRLDGYAAMPALRYSGAVRPDAFQNLVAAGVALAESYAVLRAAKQHPCVTSVVPYLGEAAPFRASLASVRAEVTEGFARHKVLVPVLSGRISEGLWKELQSLARSEGIAVLTDAPERGVKRTTEVQAEHDADAASSVGTRPDIIFGALAAQADGDFVEWVLPGETVAPQKLRAMVTSFLLQDEPFAFYVSDAPQQPHAPGSPYLEVGVSLEENVMRRTREGFYHMLLTFGAVPTGGMSAMLLRREQMEACGWLRDCFVDGRFDLFQMYRTLLLGPGCDGRPNVGTLCSCYHGGSPEAALADCVRHQMTWRRCLQRDGGSLEPEQRAWAIDRFRRNGIALLTQALESGVDMDAPLWHSYQAMLRDA